MTFKVVCLVNMNNAHIARAVLCADYQVGNVESMLYREADEGMTVQTLRVYEHWSAVVVHPTAGAERDCKGGEP